MMTDTTERRANRASEVQLYWDDQDAEPAGWTLRWRDPHGALHHRPIDGDEDCAATDLAVGVDQAIASGDAGLLGVTAKVKILRGESARGSITIEDGEVTSWRDS
jgi:hypothetical protein